MLGYHAAERNQPGPLPTDRRMEATQP
jgi:hypothetical protein